HDGGGQVAVLRGERVHLAGAQEFVAVGVSRRDAEQDMEGGAPRGSDHDQLPEASAGLESVPAQKFAGSHTALPFRLNFDEFDPGTVAARDEDGSLLNDYAAGVGGADAHQLRGQEAMDGKFLPVQRGPCPGPGLEAAPAVVEG